MKSRWSDTEAADFVARYGETHGEALALRTYTSRLLGAESDLVLHGGGNTSLKGPVRDVHGDEHPGLFVKASGWDLASMEPQGHVACLREPLERLAELGDLDDTGVGRELRRSLLDPGDPTPSIEAPVHAVVPARFVDHTHADALLALGNQPEGEKHLAEALGDDVTLLPYVRAGLRLAPQVAEGYAGQPGALGMVWLKHGVLTWGEEARDAYERMIELVSRAEAYLEHRAERSLHPVAATSLESANARLERVAPLLRGLLAQPTGDADRPLRPPVFQPLVNRAVLDLLSWEGARELLVTPPLTADHSIRTKAFPAWADGLDFEDEARLTEQLRSALDAYAADYGGYVKRHGAHLRDFVFDTRPRVVMIPGLGAICAGADAKAARIARDITEHTLTAKGRTAAMGAPYRGLPEADLFDMEYRPDELAKLGRGGGPPLAGRVALVTGAAGAIGAAICEGLVQAGAHVAATDLPGDRLDRLAEELRARDPDRGRALPLDVTDAASVAAAFGAIARGWGGVDLVVANAGLAHVASLSEMDLERFASLEHVNVHGTLLLLREAGRHFARQGTGGDVVLVSTKNVFAPGARFGAYSATKAAAHQLARIASLEFAANDVRVNMVAPDAVFSHGDRSSGLWAEVGPDRMAARGLDADCLERYYRERNLLKARVEARHVANAVLFFATRQTPTTGATLPVDGGLPRRDAALMASKPHVAPLSRQDLPDFEPLFQLAEGAMGFLPNSILTMARWPEMARAFTTLAATINLGGRLPPELKRLVSFVASRAAGCVYCQAHTSHGVERAGGADAKIEAAFEFETSPLFSEAERAALGLARDAAQVPSAASAEHFEALRRHFDEAEIVELVAVISLFGFLNRWNDTLATPLEDAPAAFPERVLGGHGWSVGKHGD